MPNNIFELIYVVIGIIFVNVFWIGAIIGVQFLYRKFVKKEKFERTEKQREQNKKIGIIFLIMFIYYIVYSIVGF